ncbi:MAG: IS1380 family transposase, partial [Gammaproteobacteria bacterium]|nr:IS1380 family transposase [Gammaproteobacteria bacterium]
TPLPILVRLDGGNDSIENIDVILEFNDRTSECESVDFIIKWNPRQQDRESWLAPAEQQGRWSESRAGKRVALFSISHERT